MLKAILLLRRTQGPSSKIVSAQPVDEALARRRVGGQMTPAEQFWQRSAEGGARNPANWLYRAEGLKRSADRLQTAHAEARLRLFNAGILGMVTTPDEVRDELFAEGFAYLGPSIMLAGFAFENLLKGLLVAKQPEQWVRKNEDKLLEWRGHGHDLVVLAKRAGITVTEAEEQLLDRIGLFLVWAGRYPVAMRASDMRPRDPAGTEWPASWPSDFDPQMDALFDKLRSALEHACLERGEAERLAEEGTRMGRSSELLDMLNVRYLRVEREGLLMFETDAAEECLVRDEEAQFRTAVACGCGASFVLHTAARPAVICRCPQLHFADLEFNVNREMPVSRTYPLP